MTEFLTYKPHVDNSVSNQISWLDAANLREEEKVTRRKALRDGRKSASNMSIIAVLGLALIGVIMLAKAMNVF